MKDLRFHSVKIHIIWDCRLWRCLVWHVGTNSVLYLQNSVGHFWPTKIQKGVTIRGEGVTLRWCILCNFTNGLSLWLFVCLSVYGSTILCLTLASFQFPNPIHTVGRTPRTGNQPITRPLPTHRTTPTQNKRTQTSMPRVGSEPTIPVSERAKTVHALDRAATVTGLCSLFNDEKCQQMFTCYLFLKS
jgi:hypothetical protein